MSVEGVDFGAVALMAATRDLTAPLVLLRQLSFELDQQLQGQPLPGVGPALAQMRLTIGRTFDIADQLKIAVTEEGNMALEPVQLTGLCQTLSNKLAPLQNELNCQLSYELPRRGNLMAVGNYRALEVVMTGFLTDALRYSKPSCNTNQRIVRLKVTTNHQNEIAISICDNGPPVNLAQSLSQLRVESNSNPIKTRPLMGSLNLLLAERLMRAMNGRLLLHNHRVGGLTIETRLPVSRQLSLIEGV